VVLCSALSIEAANWPSWRGPNQNGIAAESNFPVKWGQSENIRWRVDLPDRGNSSPIVWGGKVFVTQAVDKEQTRSVMCFDRTNGKLLWQTGFTYTLKDQTHQDNPYAAASPVTDGNVVIATFGPAGTAAFDLDGKQLWKKELGPQQHEWGYASSPFLWKGTCFVFQGPGPHSTLFALDAATGAERWRSTLKEPLPTERTDGFKGNLPGRIGSFSTPLLINNAGRRELIMSLPENLIALDPENGKLIWECKGLNPLVYTSPAWGEDTLVTMGGFFGSSLGVKPAKGSGDITSKRSWHEVRAKKNRLGAPIIYKGHLYVMNMDGMAECRKLSTGEEVWLERLKGPGAKAESWSSFTLAGDLLYIANQSGDCFVIKASPTFQQVAVNSVGEYTNSTFAHSEGELFLRTWKGLWCISEVRKTAATVDPN